MRASAYLLATIMMMKTMIMMMMMMMTTAVIQKEKKRERIMATATEGAAGRQRKNHLSSLKTMTKNLCTILMMKITEIFQRRVATRNKCRRCLVVKVVQTGKGKD